MATTMESVGYKRREVRSLNEGALMRLWLAVVGTRRPQLARRSVRDQEPPPVADSVAARAEQECWNGMMAQIPIQ